MRALIALVALVVLSVRAGGTAAAHTDEELQARTAKKPRCHDRAQALPG